MYRFATDSLWDVCVQQYPPVHMGSDGFSDLSLSEGEREEYQRMACGAAKHISITAERETYYKLHCFVVYEVWISFSVSYAVHVFLCTKDFVHVYARG